MVSTGHRSITKQMFIRHKLSRLTFSMQFNQFHTIKAVWQDNYDQRQYNIDLRDELVCGFGLCGLSGFMSTLTEVGTAVQ